MLNSRANGTRAYKLYADLLRNDVAALYIMLYIMYIMLYLTNLDLPLR